jgi:hypothetical protein
MPHDPTPRSCPDARWALTTRGEALLEAYRRLDAARAVRNIDPALCAYQLAKAARARAVYAALDHAAVHHARKHGKAVCR